MAKKFPIAPKHPERLCWGCDKYCPADSLACGNGSERTQHPVELFGEDWMEWGIDAEAAAEPDAEPAAEPATKAGTKADVDAAVDAAAAPDKTPER